MTPAFNWLILVGAITINSLIGVPKIIRGEAWGWINIVAVAALVFAGISLFCAERRRKAVFAERDAWFEKSQRLYGDSHFAFDNSSLARMASTMRVSQSAAERTLVMIY